MAIALKIVVDAFEHASSLYSNAAHKPSPMLLKGIIAARLQKDAPDLSSNDQEIYSVYIVAKLYNTFAEQGVPLTIDPAFTNTFQNTRPLNDPTFTTFFKEEIAQREIRARRTIDLANAARKVTGRQPGDGKEEKDGKEQQEKQYLSAANTAREAFHRLQSIRLQSIPVFPSPELAEIAQQKKRHANTVLEQFTLLHTMLEDDEDKEEIQPLIDNWKTIASLCSAEGDVYAADDYQTDTTDNLARLQRIHHNLLGRIERDKTRLEGRIVASQSFEDPQLQNELTAAKDQAITLEQSVRGRIAYFERRLQELAAGAPADSKTGTRNIDVPNRGMAFAEARRLLAEQKAGTLNIKLQQMTYAEIEQKLILPILATEPFRGIDQLLQDAEANRNVSGLLGVPEPQLTQAEYLERARVAKERFDAAVMTEFGRSPDSILQIVKVTKQNFEHDQIAAVTTAKTTYESFEARFQAVRDTMAVDKLQHMTFEEIDRLLIQPIHRIDQLLQDAETNRVVASVTDTQPTQAEYLERARVAKEQFDAAILTEFGGTPDRILQLIERTRPDLDANQTTTVSTAKTTYEGFGTRFQTVQDTIAASPPPPPPSPPEAKKAKEAEEKTKDEELAKKRIPFFADAYMIKPVGLMEDEYKKMTRKSDVFDEEDDQSNVVVRLQAESANPQASAGQAVAGALEGFSGDKYTTEWFDTKHSRINILNCGDNPHLTREQLKAPFAFGSDPRAIYIETYNAKTTQWISTVYQTPDNISLTRINPADVFMRQLDERFKESKQSNEAREFWKQSFETFAREHFKQGTVTFTEQDVLDLVRLTHVMRECCPGRERDEVKQLIAGGQEAPINDLLNKATLDHQDIAKDLFDAFEAEKKARANPKRPSLGILGTIGYHKFPTDTVTRTILAQALSLRAVSGSNVITITDAMDEKFVKEAMLCCRALQLLNPPITIFCMDQRVGVQNDQRIAFSSVSDLKAKNFSDYIYQNFQDILCRVPEFESLRPPVPHDYDNQPQPTPPNASGNAGTPPPIPPGSPHVSPPPSSSNQGGPPASSVHSQGPASPIASPPRVPASPTGSPLSSPRSSPSSVPSRSSSSHRDSGSGNPLMSPQQIQSDMHFSPSSKQASLGSEHADNLDTPSASPKSVRDLSDIELTERKGGMEQKGGKKPEKFTFDVPRPADAEEPSANNDDDRRPLNHGRGGRGRGSSM